MAALGKYHTGGYGQIGVYRVNNNLQVHEIYDISMGEFNNIKGHDI